MMFTAWVAHLQCAAFATRLPTVISECGRTRTYNALSQWVTVTCDTNSAHAPLVSPLLENRTQLTPKSGGVTARLSSIDI